jgi:regulator of protease activity HflC (stomatin/prohibitin superfamily)
VRNPFREVVTVLLVTALVGAVCAAAGGIALVQPVLLDVAIALFLASGALGDVLEPTVKLGRATAAIAALAMALIVLARVPLLTTPLPLLRAEIGAAVCLVAAGLAATAARYLGQLDPAALPDAPGLCRLARVLAWMLGLAAVSIGLRWARQDTAVQVIHVAMLVFDALICRSLSGGAVRDIGVLSMLGNRPNIFASVLDSAERQLGIDLRSTWALTVVRRGFEPLVIALFLVGWLSTSLTVIGVEQQGLVERLGVPVGGPPLAAGLHVHWPWPVDRIYRVPVRRVRALSVGKPTEEEGGPENVLWSVEHAPDEYTLVLGNGRDLITIDATITFRIVDVRAWRYNCQNPAAALKSLALRAVMRNTVDRTLADALSENLALVTEQMRQMVQRDADALRLGVEITGFTVGGMHPPVPVAASYEAVVSAEIDKGTASVNAQAYRNRALPDAEAGVLVNDNQARGDSAETLARAAGEAWSFRALESQYRAAPEEYLFRRRLETLEKDLAGRGFTVVDARIIRDGGELWSTP